MMKTLTLKKSPWIEITDRKTGEVSRLNKPAALTDRQSLRAIANKLVEDGGIMPDSSNRLRAVVTTRPRAGDFGTRLWYKRVELLQSNRGVKLEPAIARK